MTENEMLQRVKGADNFRKVMNSMFDAVVFAEGTSFGDSITLRALQENMNRADTMVKVLSLPNAE